jgi:hypothetical protein
MPGRHETTEQVSSTDPFLRMIVTTVVVLALFLTAVTALALGMTWKALLHWTGVVLLLTGIGLAARGIIDVRHQWTQRPGSWGTVKQRTQPARTRAASFLWARWNRAVGKWPRAAKRLYLRAYGATVHAGVAEALATVPTPTVSAEVSWGAPPVNGTPEERLGWLEDRLVMAGGQLRDLYAWREQEARDRKAAIEQERSARLAGDQGIRDSIANYAGGGLRLQAVAVARLLAGTLITAIW